MPKAKYTNNNQVSLPMAVWLARDEYKHDPRENVISVTSLLKSTRQIVLGSRVPQGYSQEDVSNLLASRIGTAVHNSVEAAWTQNHEQALLDLGYPKRAVERVKVNPTSTEPNDIPIHFEVRTEKQVGKWIISGQFDIVFEGAVHDVKSTSVYTYINNTNDDKYIQQMSLYKWLNPEMITKNHGYIEFVFKDWQKHMAQGKGKYPPLPVLQYKLKLNSVPHTEAWVRSKLLHIDNYWNEPEDRLPLCTPDELWQGAPQYKYYATDTSKRATKVFENPTEAKRHQLDKGKGIIKIVYSEPTACRYCSAAPLCSQFAKFVQTGQLKL